MLIKIAGAWVNPDHVSAVRKYDGDVQIHFNGYGPTKWMKISGMDLGTVAGFINDAKHKTAFARYYALYEAMGCPEVPNIQ